MKRFGGASKDSDSKPKVNSQDQNNCVLYKQNKEQLFTCFALFLIG